MSGLLGTVLPAGAVALALLLALPPRPEPTYDASPRGLPGRAVVVGALVGCGALLHGRGLVLGLIVTVTAALGWRLVLLRRRDREAQARAVLVLEWCDTLAGDLAVGTPPHSALEQAARDFH